MEKDGETENIQSKLEVDSKNDSASETEYKKGEKNTILIIILILGIVFFLLIIIGIISWLYLDTGMITADKPVIYIYPEEETEISVQLGHSELITCSYPKYENAWEVMAYPDGTLIDTNTRKNAIFFILGGKRNSFI